MAKANILEALYSKHKSPLEFNFDMLTAPPLLSLLSAYDIMELNRIARSIKLSGKIDEKYRLIDNIMNARGFVKLHAGTNRVVYRFLEDQRFVVKVAIDKVGLGDNPAEFNNQFLLKPFVTKVFEVSPCGTVGLFERVDAIMSREEFLSVADDIFNLITKVFVGKYVLEDFGSWYFMNYGVRRNGYGPVLLDFPYVYELDGNKLYCNAAKYPGSKERCGGQLDYDDGFNNLICTKCGKRYQARELKKAEKDQLIIVGGKKTMKVRVKLGKEVIYDSSKNKTAKVIEEPENNISENINISGLENDNEQKVQLSKVESRLNITIDKKENDKPSVGIFNKRDTSKESQLKMDLDEKENKPLEPETSEVNEFIEEDEKTSVQSMTEELDDFLEDYEEDIDDEDEEEYDQYLSNRERKNIRMQSKGKKRRNMDFSDF